MDIFFQRINTEDLITPSPKEEKSPILNTTLAVLGCGSLGTSLICGVLASIEEKDKQTNTLPKSQISPEIQGFTVPTDFAGYVRTHSSASRLATALAKFPTHVQIHTSTESLQTADIIILACQSTDLRSCLENPEVKLALVGKLLISVLPGVSVQTISSILETSNDTNEYPTTIIRAITNATASIRQSMTIIESPPSTTPSVLRTVDWIFNSIGKVKHVPVEKFDSCTALCASTPAFFAVVLEALIDGAVAVGLSREDAKIMAAHAMKGCGEMVLKGEHPVSVKEKITTPGGSTIRGLLKLEKGNMRSVVAEAFIECTNAVGGA